MQPRFRTVFEEDLFGAGCASSIELLSERVFRPFFERFFSWAKAYGPATVRKWFARSCVEQDSVSDDSLPVVSLRSAILDGYFK